MGNRYRTVFSPGLLQCCYICVTSQPLLSLSEALHRSTSEGFPALVYLPSAHGQCQHLRTPSSSATQTRIAAVTQVTNTEKHKNVQTQEEAEDLSEPNLIFIPFCDPAVWAAHISWDLFKSDSRYSNVVLNRIQIRFFYWSHDDQWNLFSASDPFFSVEQ